MVRKDYRKQTFRHSYYHGLRLILVAMLFFQSCSTAKRALDNPDKMEKREIRAAWIPTIYRSDYSKLSRQEGRRLLGKRLEELAEMNCNMVIFQARAEGDSWYNSLYEPKSRFFLGEGRSKSEDWDPLAFVISEGHRLGMAVHVWINPYRASASSKLKLSPKHAAAKHPEWVIPYGNQLYFDPGLPEYRRYLIDVLRDLVMRYDLDGLHLDDYFYPYPQAGLSFDDDKSFERYGIAMGYSPEDKAIWRRNNVTLLIDQIHELLVNTKPWVALSLSPFGIYRNKKDDPQGSRTDGLAAYDDLYADILHWVEEGWITYLMPQVYWNIGNEKADYQELVPWWHKRVGQKAQLAIGQDIERTMRGGQLYDKLALSRRYALGNVWWPADELWKNKGNIQIDLKRFFQRTKALLPEIKGPLGKVEAPERLSYVMEDVNEEGHILMWEDRREQDNPESAYMYGIYAIPRGSEIDIDNPVNLIDITSSNMYRLPSFGGKSEYTFLITVINRFWQESEPFKIKVKL